jgi:hypothetical protein
VRECVSLQVRQEDSGSLVYDESAQAQCDCARLWVFNEDRMGHSCMTRAPGSSVTVHKSGFLMSKEWVAHVRRERPIMCWWWLMWTKEIAGRR